MAKGARFLLDTNIVSYAAKADWKRPETNLHWISRHLRLVQGRCFLPSVAIQEMTYGVHHKSIGRRRQARQNRWINSLPKLDFDYESARIAGELQAHLNKRGISIDPGDLQIAAMALRYDMILVTANEKDFVHIPNLRLANWAVQPISSDAFLREHIFGSLPPLYLPVACAVAWVAYSLTLQPLNGRILGPWFPSFVLAVVLLSAIAGVLLWLAAAALVRSCIELRRRRFI